MSDMSFESFEMLCVVLLRDGARDKFPKAAVAQQAFSCHRRDKSIVSGSLTPVAKMDLRGRWLAIVAERIEDMVFPAGNFYKSLPHHTFPDVLEFQVHFEISRNISFIFRLILSTSSEHGLFSSSNANCCQRKSSCASRLSMSSARVKACLNTKSSLDLAT